MTESEAIIVLNMIETHGPLPTMAKEMSIKALEKQIPKKPIRRRATDDDVENELRDFITSKGEICRCPTCVDCIAIYELKYCMECGQKLDWGE